MIHQLFACACAFYPVRSKLPPILCPAPYMLGTLESRFLHDWQPAPIEWAGIQPVGMEVILIVNFQSLSFLPQPTLWQLTFVEYLFLEIDHTRVNFA